MFFGKKLNKKEVKNRKEKIMKLQKTILNKYRNNIVLCFISKDLRQQFKNLNNMVMDGNIQSMINKEKSKAIKIDRIIKSAPNPKYKKVIHKIEFYGVNEIGRKKNKNK